MEEMPRRGMISEQSFEVGKANLPGKKNYLAHEAFKGRRGKEKVTVEHVHVVEGWKNV